MAKDEAREITKIVRVWMERDTAGRQRRLSPRWRRGRGVGPWAWATRAHLLRQVIRIVRCSLRVQFWKSWVWNHPGRDSHRKWSLNLRNNPGGRISIFYKSVNWDSRRPCSFAWALQNCYSKFRFLNSQLQSFFYTITATCSLFYIFKILFCNDSSP